jgi:hypothetical protein
VDFSEKSEYCDGIFPFIFVFRILAKVYKKEKLITLGVCVFFSPYFVRQAVEQSSTKGLSQIWLQVREESRKV